MRGRNGMECNLRKGELQDRQNNVKRVCENVIGVLIKEAIDNKYDIKANDAQLEVKVVKRLVELEQNLLADEDELVKLENSENLFSEKNESPVDDEVLAKINEYVNQITDGIKSDINVKVDLKRVLEVYKKYENIKKLAKELHLVDGKYQDDVMFAYQESEEKVGTKLNQSRLLVQLEEVTKKYQDKIDQLYKHYKVEKSSVEDLLVNESLLRHKVETDKVVMEKFGVVLTENIDHVMFRTVSSLEAGEKVMLLGPTGVAKTQMMRAVAYHMGYKSEDYKEPDVLETKNDLSLSWSDEDSSKVEVKNDKGKLYVVSCSADMTVSDLYGNMVIDEKNGASVTKFEDGFLTSAIKTGGLVVLDEINSVEAGVLKVLNDLLTKKAGQQVQIPGTDEVVTVHPEFRLVSTANEADKKGLYVGVGEISADLLARYTVVQVEYPDLYTSKDVLPKDLLRIANAVTCYENGERFDFVNHEELEDFVYLVHEINQAHFEVSVGEKRSESGELNIDNLESSKLQKKSMPPRTMVKILQKMVKTGGRTSLKIQMNEWLNSTSKDDDDYKVAKDLLKKHNMLLEDDDVRKIELGRLAVLHARLLN